jgi:hypothetical protein
MTAARKSSKAGVADGEQVERSTATMISHPRLPSQIGSLASALLGDLAA